MQNLKIFLSLDVQTLQNVKGYCCSLFFCCWSCRLNYRFEDKKCKSIDPNVTRKHHYLTSLILKKISCDDTILSGVDVSV